MELTIIQQNGGAYIDSREVAAAIGKRHADLLRDIERYRKYVERAIERKIAFNDFFVESTYTDSIGRTLPCYLVSKRGAEVIATKLTGEKGVLFSFAYVAKFNQLEAAEREREIAERNTPRLTEFNSAVRNVLDGMSFSRATPSRVMNFLSGVYNPLGIAVLPEGDDCDYYTATDIARVIGVFSESGRPHGHAIGAIISKLDVHSGHCVMVPYGLVGFSFRYDAQIAEAVLNWLAERRFPNNVPHDGFEYHIYYDRRNPLFVGHEDDYDMDDPTYDGFLPDDDDDWFGDEE
jgi:Rha family phage regulatory protein